MNPLSAASICSPVRAASRINPIDAHRRPRGEPEAQPVGPVRPASVRLTSRTVRPAQAASTTGAASVVSHPAKNDGIVSTWFRLRGRWALNANTARTVPWRSSRDRGRRWVASKHPHSLDACRRASQAPDPAHDGGAAVDNGGRRDRYGQGHGREDGPDACMERLTGMDAAFLYLESATWHMHVSMVGIYDVSTMPGGYSFEPSDSTSPTACPPSRPSTAASWRCRSSSTIRSGSTTPTSTSTTTSGASVALLPAVDESSPRSPRRSPRSRSTAPVRCGRRGSSRG